MNQFYTAESVTEGHPDKLCDIIADSVLDACLAHDMFARGEIGRAHVELQSPCVRF